MSFSAFGSLKLAEIWMGPCVRIEVIIFRVEVCPELEHQSFLSGRETRDHFRDKFRCNEAWGLRSDVVAYVRRKGQKT